MLIVKTVKFTEFKDFYIEVYATIFKPNLGFYLFTNVEPYAEEADGSAHSRDVYNEKPLKGDMITAVEEEAPQSKLCNRCASNY